MKKNKQDFRFSDDQKSQLESALKKYNQGEVRWFIGLLEPKCGILLRIKSNLSRLDNREKIGDAIKDLRKALGHVEQINAEKFIPSPQRYFMISSDERVQVDESGKFVLHEDFETEDPDKEARAVSFFTHECTSALIKPLQALILILERSLKVEARGSGRPRADENNFIRSIAVDFTRHFGKPHPYRGVFHEVVRIAFEAMGIGNEDQDYSRGIRQALRTLDFDKIFHFWRKPQVHFVSGGDLEWRFEIE